MSQVHGYSGVSLFPTPSQERQLARIFGCVRYVYNSMINARQWEYEHGIVKFLGKDEEPVDGKRYKRSAYDWRKVLTTQAKKQYPWLKEVPSVALQQAVILADKNYRAMVKNRSNGKKASLPRKRKYGSQSFELTRTSFKVRQTSLEHHRGYIYIPTVGEVRYHAGTDITKTSSIIIKLTRDGKYNATVRLQAKERQVSPHASESVALDLGLSSYVTTVSTDGEVAAIPNPRKYRKAQKKLSRTQRALSRKKRGSNNRAKHRARVAKAHKKVKNQRQDFLHKLSSTLADNNHAVIVEDLNVSGMSKNKRLSKSIYDAGWGMFIDMLHYKAAEVVVIDRFFPSSQICCVCGHKDGKKELHIRQWECPGCQATLDRDINAAINLLDAGGYAESLNACGGDVRRFIAQPLSSVKQEYSSTCPTMTHGDNHELMMLDGDKKPRP